MDAPEAEVDIKLQKISADLIADFDKFLPKLLRRSDGTSRVYPRVRARDLDWATGTCLDPFQELPQLLDAHLPKWVPFLSEAFLEHTQARHRRRGGNDSSTAATSKSRHLVSVEHAICKILYTLCKVRGEKVIVHFLNVEARYLEVLLSAMEEAEAAPTEAGKWSWEQRYVVLLWLSHLMLAPFDLSTISSADAGDGETGNGTGLPESLVLPPGLPGITMRAIPLAVRYLSSPGRERDGARALLVRVAMRRDMQAAGVLAALVQWSLSALRPSASDTSSAPATETAYHHLGVLSFLAGILRASADTSDLDVFLRPIFDAVHGIATGEDDTSKSIVSFALARKMILKVIRFVVVSLLRSDAADDDDDDDDRTDMTETAIGYLLESLSDSDTPVRFAASKSLSIITLRLDPDMASQVVEAVLESLNRNVLWKKDPFTTINNSSSGLPAPRPVRDLATVDPLEWHGLMLTLSHLLYRRSPPANQLSDIVHALLLGLSFEKRGVTGTSVGSNVRDAACFGIWALARRYTSDELLAVPTESVYAAKHHVNSGAVSILQVLATELVTTASLDSAGNIRRGASAALQELIGRHPDTVEKGIWVVQTVDYHSVARRSRAVDEVALGSSRLSPLYGEAILDAILGWRGVGDADPASRRDAAAAFGRLTAQLASANGQGVLDRFRASVRLVAGRLNALEKRQVEERHGLLLCLAAIFDEYPSLAGEADSKTTGDMVHTATGVLEDCRDTTYRRPELVVEAAGRLAASTLPMLQQEVLGRVGLQTLAQLLPGTGSTASQGYMLLVALIDAAERKDLVDEFLLVLGEVVPQWLSSRNEADAVDAASSAALVLLLFSTPATRSSTLAQWAASVETKPTSNSSRKGDSGYLSTLATAQPLVGSNGGVGDDDVVCRALTRRWAADADVDTRVAILQALTRSRLLRERPLVFLDVLAEGLNDYTTTARGDVGSHVRVAALRAVAALWAEGEDKGEWVDQSVRKLFYSTLRLAAEKLDRIRPEAQVAVSLVLGKGRSSAFRSTSFSSRGYFRALLELVHEHSAEEGDSLAKSVTELARTDAAGWMAELLSGLVTSADTGNEELVVASRAALTDFCSVPEDNLEGDESSQVSNVDLVCRALVENLRGRQSQDRIVVPTLEVVAFLGHVGLLQRCRGRAVSLKGLCLQTQKAAYKSGNMRKLEACVRVYGAVAASFGQQQQQHRDEEADAAGVQEARKRLGLLLLHPWPRIRTAVVDELWALLAMDGGNDVGGDDVGGGDLLLGVDWGKADRGQVREVVQQMGLTSEAAAS